MDKSGDPKPKLYSASFSFGQEGNCIDGGFETLLIRCESSEGIDNAAECFFILKTEQWAIDEPKDLTDLLDRISGLIIKISE